MDGGLEVVRYQEHPRDRSVTLQVALGGILVHPFTMPKADFLSIGGERERNEFLERSARTLLDIYGDARDGRKLSDSEVQERTAA